MLPYFKVLQISNLEQISQEVRNNLTQLLPDSHTRPYSFNLINEQDLLKISPTLAAWLKSVGLYNHLQYAGLPLVAPHTVGPLHMDGKCKEAINLPVFNCGVGYSSWHTSSTLSGEILPTTDGVHTSKKAEYVSCVDDGVELVRLENAHAAWVNTALPHKGTNTGKNPRMIMTLRFDRDIDIDII